MSDTLSPEDSLRLNVLLTQDIKAVRIDESAMRLHALTAHGEASLPLHPNCRPEQYLRRVREALASYALGSPAGYPVHLSRWARHGQMDSANLGRLLLTGEPEAVVAVVHSPALTDELAAYAWWISPSIENAALMLSRRAVAQGRMGPILAEFLVEHLPFLHDDHVAIMDTVAVLLYSGVLNAAQREAIWRRGRMRNTYYVTFLQMCPEDLPAPMPARADHAEQAAALAPITAHNLFAQMLLRCLSAQGQTYLWAVMEVLDRPEVQEVVNNTLRAISEYFAPLRTLDANTAAACRAELLAHAPALKRECDALFALAQVSETDSREIFARTTAIGSLMRRKIEPLIAPLRAHLACLRGISASA